MGGENEGEVDVRMIAAERINGENDHIASLK